MTTDAVSVLGGPWIPGEWLRVVAFDPKLTGRELAVHALILPGRSAEDTTMIAVQLRSLAAQIEMGIS